MSAFERMVARDSLWLSLMYKSESSSKRGRSRAGMTTLIFVEMFSILTVPVSTIKLYTPSFASHFAGRTKSMPRRPRCSDFALNTH